MPNGLSFRVGSYNLLHSSTGHLEDRKGVRTLFII
jgi:hypothetical protein